MGCLAGSPEVAELAMLTDIIESYERQRWPEGRISGGKGCPQGQTIVHLGLQPETALKRAG
jgi:hypothetical protein